MGQKTFKNLDEQIELLRQKGLVIDDADYAKEILAYMQAEFQRGDGKGHTNWIDNSMICIVPPEYQFYLGKLDDLKYVESGHQAMAKGYIGRLCGWDILVSNNIAQPENGVFYPLFGVAGKTLAGGISSDLNTQSYVPEKSFNTCYKGYGLYGVVLIFSVRLKFLPLFHFLLVLNFI